MKTDLSQSCGHCWAFHIWHVECSTSATPLFSIWNNSAVIPSPQLAFFIVMLPKTHLTSHFRMSGSRWVTTPSWLSWLRSFLYSSVLSCYILISYASLISLPFLFFIMPILAWKVPLNIYCSKKQTNKKKTNKKLKPWKLLLEVFSWIVLRRGEKKAEKHWSYKKNPFHK